MRVSDTGAGIASEDREHIFDPFFKTKAQGKAAGPIHLLLTDVIMPQMTGRELTERVKPLRPKMKVLFMSGYAADVITSRGLLTSGEWYIAKPFSVDSLLAKVREVLSHPGFEPAS